MPQPTPYFRGYSFTDYQSLNPSVPLPAAHVDAELDGIAQTLGGVLGNLSLIQRDDGKLADGIITVDSISAELLAEITPEDGTDGVSPPPPNFTVEVTTLAPGAAATVNVTGVYPNLTVHLGIPKGDPAAAGAAVLDDGNYGDVTVSGGGTIFTITNFAAVNAAIAGKLDKAGGVVTGLINNQSALPWGYSHERVGQVGYHWYNGGGVTGWLAYQPAHANGDDFRLGTEVAGVITDRLTLSKDGLLAVTGPAAGVSFVDRDGVGSFLGYVLNDIFRLWMAGDKFTLDSAGNATFGGGITSGGVAVSLAGHTHTMAEIVGLPAALAGKQPAGAYATTAQLAAKADAFTTVLPFDTDAAFSDGNNGQYLVFTGNVARMATFNDLTDGWAGILANRSTVNLTIACPGGYFKNGGAPSGANFTLAPNGKISCFHEGAGVWTFDGTGVP
jgi:hypothetical protein